MTYCRQQVHFLHSEPVDLCMLTFVIMAAAWWEAGWGRCGNVEASFSVAPSCLLVGPQYAQIYRENENPKPLARFSAASSKRPPEPLPWCARSTFTCPIVSPRDMGVTTRRNTSENHNKKSRNHNKKCRKLDSKLRKSERQVEKHPSETTDIAESMPEPFVPTDQIFT